MRIVSHSRCGKWVNSLLYLEILSYILDGMAMCILLKIVWLGSWKDNDLLSSQWYSKGDTYNLLGGKR